jgi:DNA-binding transcriptional LysR family regulator
MEFRNLRYFVVVAREGHFGRAARKLNVTQPAVSRAIQALEEELDVKLFERLPRGVRLAGPGERYLREVERILDDLASAARLAKGVSDLEKRELRVGHSLMKTLEKEFDFLLERFSSSEPNVHLKLQYLNSFEQQSALHDHAIDLGFGHVCGAPLPGLTKMRVKETPFCGARVGIGHRFAGRAKLSLFELRDEPLLIYRRDLNPQMFDYVVRELRAAGFAGEIVQNAEFSFWNWKVMRKDSGWMLANRDAMSLTLEDTVCVPIPGLSIPFGIDLIWSEDNRSDALEAFLSTARTVLRATPSRQS